MWQLATDYKTGLPLAGIGAWFLYVNDVSYLFSLRLGMGWFDLFCCCGGSGGAH